MTPPGKRSATPKMYCAPLERSRLLVMRDIYRYERVAEEPRPWLSSPGLRRGGREVSKTGNGIEVATVVGKHKQNLRAVTVHTMA